MRSSIAHLAGMVIIFLLFLEDLLQLYDREKLTEVQSILIHVLDISKCIKSYQNVSHFRAFGFSLVVIAHIEFKKNISFIYLYRTVCIYFIFTAVIFIPEAVNAMTTVNTLQTALIEQTSSMVC